MSTPAVPLSDVAVSRGLVGGPFGSSLVNNDYTSSGVPVISGTNLGFGRRLGGAYVFVSDEKVARDLARNTAIPGDIVFTQRGTLGQVALVPNDTYSHFVVSQSQMRLRVDPARAVADYVYYACTSESFMKQIDDNAISTGVPHINLGILNRLTIPLPSLREQRAIAEVLGALDDKIANNIEIAWTAEELLQASYRGLLNEVPSRQVLVESLVRRITPKRKFAKDELLTQGDFPVFDQSDSGFLGYLNGEGFLVASAEEPILYFGDHTCKLRIAVQRFTVGPNTIPFTGSGISSLTLYCALNGLQNHEEYKRHWQLLMKKEVTVPDAQAATAFALRHGHLLSLLQSVSRENTCLVATRDALLPQLMSGKLRVKDAEKVLEEAGV